MYDQPTVAVHEAEADNPDSEAIWLALADAAADPRPVYPDGLLDLLSRDLV